jgi:RNA polymerase sigma-70 factor (ECF subfamily)
MNPLVTGDTPDSALVEAVREGDHLAFKDLFYRYYHKLFRFAVVHVHSSELAADLVQEVFFRVWERRENLIPQKSIKAYLYKILNNLIINQLKLASTKTSSYEDALSVNTVGNESKLDSEIDIHLAIDKLPAKLRSVFVLIKVEGFKYQEVAEICGISVKAVEKRMTQVLSLLKKHLS